MITDNGLAALAQGCPDLRTIYLKGCSQITDNSINHIAENCKNLTDITFDLNDNITTQSLHALIPLCHSLSAISLDYNFKPFDAIIELQALCEAFASSNTNVFIDGCSYQNYFKKYSAKNQHSNASSSQLAINTKAEKPLSFKAVFGIQQLDTLLKTNVIEIDANGYIVPSPNPYEIHCTYNSCLLYTSDAADE